MESGKIRVLIANPTRMLRDFLYDAIRKEPGIEVVGDVCEESAILPAAERTNPDCLIVPLSQPGKPMTVCAEILAVRPHVRIVALGEGTNILAIYWKCEEGQIRCTYGAASRRNILQALSFATS